MPSLIFRSPYQKVSSPPFLTPLNRSCWQRLLITDAKFFTFAYYSYRHSSRTNISFTSCTCNMRESRWGQKRSSFSISIIWKMKPKSFWQLLDRRALRCNRRLNTQKPMLAYRNRYGVGKEFLALEVVLQSKDIK